MVPAARSGMAGSHRPRAHQDARGAERLRRARLPQRVHRLHQRRPPRRIGAAPARVLPSGGVEPHQGYRSLAGVVAQASGMAAADRGAASARGGSRTPGSQHRPPDRLSGRSRTAPPAERAPVPPVSVGNRGLRPLHRGGDERGRGGDHAGRPAHERDDRARTRHPAAVVAYRHPASRDHLPLRRRGDGSRGRARARDRRRAMPRAGCGGARVVRGRTRGVPAAARHRAARPARGGRRMIRVNLVARDNGIGRGALRKALHPLKLRMGSVARRLGGRGAQRWDVNLMLERVRPEYLATARRNVLLPHPEWFDQRDRAWLPRLDRVFALTRHAVPIFERLGMQVDYTGFTSEDRLDPGVPRERTFFHLAGRSANKGTDTLLALWRRHPEWPRLTVLQSPRVARAVVQAPNIAHRVEYIPDGELRRIQNAHRFHLCPSETEGFGHYLVEAMGVGAVTVTLDAPPMNEMVTPERGALIPFSRTGTQSLATTYFYEPEAMQAVIERLLQTPDRELERLGAAARAWFEDNDRAFRRRIVQALAALV